MRVNIDISQIRDVVKILLENEGDNEVIITPEQYINYLKFAGYDGKAVQNMKQFRGKRIVVDGNLDLSRTDAKNITNITVKGSLDVSNTQVNSLEGVVTTTYISKYGTPLEKMLIKREREKKIAEQETLRANDEWNLETFEYSGSNKITSFSSTFLNCNSLVEVVSLYTTSGSSFPNTFQGCINFKIFKFVWCNSFF